jgi:broad specificity phosphatase PhoE
MSKPVAYAAVAADGSESVYVASLKEQAEACCRDNGWFLLPLYAAPPTWQEDVAAVEAAFERSGVQPTWPDDEAGNVGPMAEAMADEIGRLRFAIHSLAEQDATLFVSGGVVTVTIYATLTDEERQAIEWCIFQQATPQRTAVTLRNLLERLS